MLNNLHTFVILAYKESPYLEACIKSITKQTQQSEILIATTTPNTYIKNLAKQYNLKIIKGVHTTIGGDFDFAIHTGKTPLVTVAHQDDIYEPSYTKEIIHAYHKYPNSSIIFTDYYEIRNKQKVYTNTNLKIKRFLLSLLKIKKSTQSKWLKRLPLRFGCSICCPAVTFVTKNCPQDIFKSHFRCNCDWHAWEKLSKRNYSFTYIPFPLIGHRVSESSTTTEIINSGLRTKEDYEIFCRFWPRLIARLLTKIYQNSEKSNNPK